MIVQIERRIGSEVVVASSGLDDTYGDYVFRALAKIVELEQDRIFASTPAQRGNHRVASEVDGARSASLVEECRCEAACFEPRIRRVEWEVVPYRPR